MPQIREYVAQGTPRARLPGSGGAVAGQAAAQASGAMEQLGQTLASVVSHYEDVRRDTVAAKAAATATRDLRQFVLEMQEGSQDEQGNFTPPADPIEHPARFKAKVQEINDTYGRELGDENMGSRFQTRFAPQVTASLLDVQKVSLDRQKAQAEADVMETEDSLIRSLTMNASDIGEDVGQKAAFGEIQSVYDRMVQAGAWKPEEAVKRRLLFASRVSTAFVTRDILENPSSALTLLNGNEAYSGLLPEKREAWKRVAQRAIQAEIAASKSKGDPALYRRMRTLAAIGELTQDQLNAASSLSNAEYNSIFSTLNADAPRARGHRYIHRFINGDANPALGPLEARLADEWDRWIDEHPNPTQEEAREAFTGMVKDVAFLGELPLAMPVPLFLQGDRMDPDFQATRFITTQAFEDGDIDEREYDQQIDLVDQYEQAIQSMRQLMQNR